MIYSTATPIVAASVTTLGQEAKVVNTGDTVTNLVVVKTDGTEETIASATVAGYKLGNAPIASGSTVILDGIPAYVRDADGGIYGTAEELFTVDAMVLEVPDTADASGLEEGEAATTVRVVQIADIKAIGEVTPVVGNQSGATAGGGTAGV